MGCSEPPTPLPTPPRVGIGVPHQVFSSRFLVAKGSCLDWQQVYFIGLPIVVDSVPPSLLPPTFCITSLRVRPMQAFARWPEPKQPCLTLISACSQAAPDTTTHGVAPIVVAEMPCRLNLLSTKHSHAATTTAKCFGAHPAITALIAHFSTVSTPLLGATLPFCGEKGDGERRGKNKPAVFSRWRWRRVEGYSVYCSR